MVYEPQNYDLYCRHSLKNILVNSFTWAIIVFGMIYLVLIIVYFKTIQQDYRLSTLTLNYILTFDGICSIDVGYFFYRNQKSQCLFFTDSGVYLRKKIVSNGSAITRRFPVPVWTMYSENILPITDTRRHGLY